MPRWAGPFFQAERGRRAYRGASVRGDGHGACRHRGRGELEFEGEDVVEVRVERLARVDGQRHLV